MKLRIAFLAVAAALVAGACGGSSSGGSSSDLAKLLSNSTAKTRTSSARVALEITATSPQLPSGFQVSAEGEFDYAGQRGQLTEQIPDVTGSGQPARKIEIRVIGTKVYAMVPGVGTADKPWVETDAATFGAQSGSLGSSDPSQFLDYLKGASNSIKDEGEDTVRGAHTRKLAVQLDLRKALEKVSPQQREALQQAIDQMGASNLPAQVWIDDEGRLRKMTFSLHVQKSGQKADIAFSLELYDFGVNVDVQPPPPSQVTQGGL